LNFGLQVPVAINAHLTQHGEAGGVIEHFATSDVFTALLHVEQDVLASMKVRRLCRCAWKTECHMAVAARHMGRHSHPWSVAMLAVSS
jgi:hypothetical protein